MGRARLGWAKRERLLRGPPHSRFVLSGHEIGGAAGRQHLIGAVPGIDASPAYDAVQRAAQMIPTEGTAEAKQVMLDEMDRMSRHLWRVVERQESDDGPGLKAIAQLLRVQEREARLMGLDAPARRAVEVITHDTFKQALGELEADVARMEGELSSEP